MGEPTAILLNTFNPKAYLQVVEALLNFAELGDWRAALERTIPERKRGSVAGSGAAGPSTGVLGPHPSTMDPTQAGASALPAEVSREESSAAAAAGVASAPEGPVGPVEGPSEGALGAASAEGPSTSNGGAHAAAAAEGSDATVPGGPTGGPTTGGSEFSNGAPAGGLTDGAGAEAMGNGRGQGPSEEEPAQKKPRIDPADLAVD